LNFGLSLDFSVQAKLKVKVTHYTVIKKQIATYASPAHQTQVFYDNWMKAVLSNRMMGHCAAHFNHRRLLQYITDSNR